MTQGSREQAFARSIELWKKPGAQFDQLPAVEHRVARGAYEFFASVDSELQELEQEE
jgi:hypothetical protein